jgi:hypothetical protein
VAAGNQAELRGKWGARSISPDVGVWSITKVRLTRYTDPVHEFTYDSIGLVAVSQ